jgi:hypothetical protein
MLSHILYVFMQKTYQPHRHNHGNQPLGRFQQGDSTQAKMFCEQVLLGIHSIQG